MLANSYALDAWLIFAGIVTALPLIFFAQAALRLQLSTLGLFKYITPSLLFIWAAVLLFALENKITAFVK